MDNKKRLIIGGVILGLVLAYVGNYYLLGLSPFMFSGLLLALGVVLGIITVIISKVIKKKKGIKNTSFLFPDKVAEGMNKVDIGIQYETTVVGVMGIMLGTTLFTIYFIFFTDFSWWLRGFYLFNWVCSLLLMGSMLVTNWQQLDNYRQVNESFLKPNVVIDKGIKEETQ